MPIFQTEADTANERAVAEILSEKFGCEIRSFGGRSEVDMYAVRDGRMAAVIELKTRKNSSTTYPTVFLSMRKYVDLRAFSHLFGVPAIFVVMYDDGIRYIDIGDVDTSRHIMGGNSRNKAYNDIEPLIEVPVESLQVL
jgi:hypothetical protein